jgi:hypothetical protein
MKMRYLVLLPLLAAATLPPPLTRAQVPVFAITPVHSKATSTGLDNRGPLALGHLMDWPTSLKDGVLSKFAARHPLRRQVTANRDEQVLRIGETMPMKSHAAPHR